MLSLLIINGTWIIDGTKIRHRISTIYKGEIIIYMTTLEKQSNEIQKLTLNSTLSILDIRESPNCS